MKEGSPLDARAAAHKVKDLARDLAGELAEGYRKSTRYFKLRAAVIGTWVALSLVTVWAACPSTGPGNSLGAEIRLSEGAGVGTQIVVVNTTDTIWRDVVITVDDDWSHAITTVRGGEHVVVALEKFQRSGAHPPQELKPRTITVSCSEGTVRTPVGRR
ncbi:MAG: hypothetical protein QM767_13500 [Anaeromyxobacter sp.]